jgi:putative transposase
MALVAPEREQEGLRMRLVEQLRLDHHDPRCAAIDAAAFASTRLDNAMLYVTRQAVIHQQQVISYDELARDVQTSMEFRALPAKVAQWVLRQAALAWKRYFAACPAWEAHPSRFLGHPKPPKSRDKRGRNLLTYTEQVISRSSKNRGYVVPSGLNIRVESRQTAINKARIAPHASHYTVEGISERQVMPADVFPSRVAEAGIGWNNLAAETFNQPGLAPFLVDGRPLKAINQWYNKRRARLQGNRPEGVYAARQLDILTDKRGRQITDYLHVASRRIVDRLVTYHVGTLVVGRSDGWKQAIGLGKRTNQNCVFVPHARFVARLEYKAELVGIRVVMGEESYTSKCSFLDLEPVGKQEINVGKRVKRGWFRASGGR